MITDKPVTLRTLKFVEELIADPRMNQEQAACRAGYSPRGAAVAAANLMNDPRVQHLIAERSKARLKRLELTQDDVLRDIFHVAMADPRDLTEYRIGCCRYCHGNGFRYQMTPREYRDRLDFYMTKNGREDPMGLAFPVEGGVGFNKNRNPHPECPECHGDGEGREVFKDSRTLSESARILYAGVKRTKNGLEIMSRSKDKAIELAARHTGVVKPGLEVTGKNGGPIQHVGAIVALATTDPVEAAAQYQKIMGS